MLLYYLMPLSWLKGIKRRTLKDKGRRKDPEEIYEMITSKVWPYKTRQEYYMLRDQALLALLYLCCGRVGEVLSLRKSQFEETEDFLIIKNYQVEKTKLYREDWPLPKRGRLAPLTNLVLKYLSTVKDDNKIFSISRQRAHIICKYVTGMWPHWFRAQGEAYYMRIIRDPFKLALALRLVDPKTLMEYIPFEWEDYREQLLR